MFFLISNITALQGGYVNCRSYHFKAKATLSYLSIEPFFLKTALFKQIPARYKRKPENSPYRSAIGMPAVYSTVTDLARLRGLSTSQPRAAAT
jgi:hypothetical protein